MIQVVDPALTPDSKSAPFRALVGYHRLLPRILSLPLAGFWAALSIAGSKRMRRMAEDGFAEAGIEVARLA